MSAMDLQTIRDFVRNSLDTDTEELPNTLLDVYIAEGYDRCIEVSDTWSFFAVEDTLSTTASTQAYNIAGDDTDRNLAFPYAYRSITDVRSDTQSLIPMAHRSVRAANRTTSPSTSRPRAFSEFGHSVYLWPIPDSAYTLTFAGYRAPIDWIAGGAGAEPDAPDEFHEVIAYHALSRGHAQAADPEMASYYAALFDTRVRSLKRRFATPLTSGPYVLNGGTGQAENPFKLFYDWE